MIPKNTSHHQNDNGRHSSYRFVFLRQMKTQPNETQAKYRQTNESSKFTHTYLHNLNDIWYALTLTCEDLKKGN